MNDQRGAPWTLWVIGVIFLVLTGVGAYDQVRTLAEDADYFRSQDYNATQVAYFTGYPTVPAIFWVIGVWFGVAAASLLLLRSRWSAPAAAVAFVGQLVLVIITFGWLDRWSVFGPRQSLFDLGVLLVTALFALYCWALARRAMLR